MIHGKSYQMSRVQTVAFYLTMVHYFKRELESLFVHRFSHGTMPLRNIFRNSAHYWLLGGVFIAYFIYGPSLAVNTAHGEAFSHDTRLCLWSSLFILSEFWNGKAHWTLRNLRPEGTRARQIPYGFGFALVSCPNYLFETTSWIFFSILVGHWSSWVFTVVSAVQMYGWAVKKHRQYLKEFPDYPKIASP